MVLYDNQINAEMISALSIHLTPLKAWNADYKKLNETWTTAWHDLTPWPLHYRNRITSWALDRLMNILVSFKWNCRSLFLLNIYGLCDISIDIFNLCTYGNIQENTYPFFIPKKDKLCSSVVTWKTSLLEARNIVRTRYIKF